MKRLYHIHLFFVMLLGISLKAQVFFNNGSIVYIGSNTNVIINGGMQDDNTAAGPGTFTNNGNLTVTSSGSTPGNILISNNAVLQGSGKFHLDQDWINNAVYIADSSTVDMYGNKRELITSNNGTVTTFDTLLLRGTGTVMNRRKQLTLNANVAGALFLNDRVLFTAGHTLYVTTPNLTAITNNTTYKSEGFISNTGSGSLSRITNSNNAYYFPVGADSAVLHYRKVLITPASVNPNTFTVRLANNDASNDGDSIKFIDTSLCNVNSLFYHIINHTSGNDSADIDIFYDASTDGVWTAMAQWNTSTANKWNNMGIVSYTSATPYSDVLKKKWNNFSNNEFILANKSIHVNLSGNNSVCYGNSDTLVATGGVNYLWSTGATSGSITVTPVSTTTYSVSISNGSCKIDTSKVVQVKPMPVAAVKGISTICSGDSTLLIANAGLSYSWSTGATTSGIYMQPAISTTYTLSISNGTCQKDTDIVVTVNDKPKGELSGNTSICSGSNTLLTASGGTFYKWNTGASTSSITVAIASKYSVVIMQNGCTDTLSTVIIVNPLPVLNACCDSTIAFGQNVQLTSSGGSTYLWSPSQGLNCNTCTDPVASPLVSTTYTLTVTSDSGCNSQQTITIDVSCGTVFVPDAFSPNGDGQNDILYVRGDCINTIYFKVFDRWGNKVFETNDKNTGWDGRCRGQAMNSGSYVYYITATLYDGTTQTKKGNVALVR